MRLNPLVQLMDKGVRLPFLFEVISKHRKQVVAKPDVQPVFQGLRLEG